MQVKLVSIVILIHIVGGIKIKVEESNEEFYHGVTHDVEVSCFLSWL